MVQAGIPAVSIVTALYNCMDYIGETIESVIAQSLHDWEMIIIDDCSTDGSERIAAGYAAKDPRIRVITLEQNSGAAVARNRAIELARGRYIAFLDSDDRWYPRKLEKQLAFMQGNSYSITHTWYEKQDEAGKYLGNSIHVPGALDYQDLLKSNFIGCLTVIYDTKTLGKVYMPLIRKRQDYGLWLKILKSGTSIHIFPENLAMYRIRSGSVSENKLEMVRYNWSLYRNVEGFGVFKSAYYLCCNIYYKVKSTFQSR